MSYLRTRNQRARPSLESECVFSACGAYRYSLRRLWHPIAEHGRGYCNWIMLNPSTADTDRNDPTVERCERYAKRWGYDGMIVTNLFALRATKPKVMLEHYAPVAEPDDDHRNDLAILRNAKLAGLVVCAWGNHGAHMGRSASVVAGLREQRVELHYLAMNQSGEPVHPLYQWHGLVPMAWRPQ